MHQRDERTTNDNVLGAIIFYSYIVAALFFTSVIIVDLLRLYRRTNDNGRPQGIDPDIRRKLQVVTSLAVLSFAVLSYHMLRVLIVSYSEWAKKCGTPLPLTLSAAFDELTLESLWTWAKASTLFQDFARAICLNAQRYWWTQQALLFSIAWNIYMAVEGKRMEIPRLWAYFVLDQILPVSFTQNLFTLAVVLQGKVVHHRSLRPANPKTQVIILGAYIGCLHLATRTIDTEWAMYILFVTRALLFSPLLFLQPSIVSSVKESQPKREVMGGYVWSRYLFLAGACLLHLSQSVKAWPLSVAVKSIEDEPAVSALGYDFILAMVSLALTRFL